MRTKSSKYKRDKPPRGQFFTTVPGMLFAGVMAAGLVYGVHHLLTQKKVESILLDLVETKRREVDDKLADMKLNAMRLSNLKIPKQALADYRAGRGGLEELRAASVPVFENFINKNGDMLGMARCSTAGGAIVEAGMKVSRERQLLPSVGNDDPVIHGPFQFENEQRLLVGVPVFTGDVSEGTDVVLFSLSGLLPSVRDYSGMGEEGEMILGASRGRICEVFFPLRGGDKVSDADEMVAEALGMTMRGETGTITGKSESGKMVMIGHTPLFEADWGLVVRIPEVEEAFQRKSIWSPVRIGLSGLGFLVTVGILLFLRPKRSKRSFARDF